MAYNLLVVLFVVFFLCLSFSSSVIIKPVSQAKLTDNTILARPNPFAQASANLTGKPYYNPALGSEVVFPDYWVVTVGN